MSGLVGGVVAPEKLRIKRAKRFTSSGNFNVPVGVKAVSVLLVGGGGGSAAGGTPSTFGLGGAVLKTVVDVSGGGSVVVVIGAGGAAGSAGNGGGTSFGDVVTFGGRGAAGRWASESNLPGPREMDFPGEGYGRSGVDRWGSTQIPNMGAGGYAGDAGSSGVVVVEWEEYE